MTVLPTMPPEQTASWLGILDLYEQLSEGYRARKGDPAALLRQQAPIHFPALPEPARYNPSNRMHK